MPELGGLGEIGRFRAVASYRRNMSALGLSQGIESQFRRNQSWNRVTRMSGKIELRYAGIAKS